VIEPVEFRDLLVRAIPHDKQQYPTVGNWRIGSSGNWDIWVSRLPDWRYVYLVALHEWIEMALCAHRGISGEDVTTFDEAFEAHRDEGNLDEPGDSDLAPYRKEHQFASHIERIVAAELGVEWDDYERAINDL
jgi:hypothetical protein